MSEPEPNDGGTAFPATAPGMSCTTAGLSKREWFAGMALTGLMQSQEARDNWGETQVADFCLQQADAMLKRLEAAP